LRFEDSGRAFVPENMIRTAELFFLGHLGREYGVDRGIVEAVSFPQSPASSFVSGGDEKIRVLTEVESVLEEKRNIRNEEGRAQFAGGRRRFKTFLTDPGVDNLLQVLPGPGILENDLPQCRAVHRSIRGQNTAAEAGGDRRRDRARLSKELVDAGIRIEDHSPRHDLPDQPAGGRFPAGDSAAEPEEMHAPTYKRRDGSCNWQMGQQKAGGRLPLRPHD